jgi:hypothetical protein
MAATDGSEEVIRLRPRIRGDYGMTGLKERRFEIADVNQRRLQTAAP